MVRRIFAPGSQQLIALAFMNLTSSFASLHWLRCPLFPLVLLWCLALQVSGSQAQDKSLLVADLHLQLGPGQGGQAGTAGPSATYYYGFPAGDVLQLDLEPGQGKAAYTLEVVDYASGSPVFSSRQVKKIKNLRLPLAHRGVYQFNVRAEGTASSPASCRFTIRRLPAHDSLRHFNSHISWRNRRDTTWTTVSEKVPVKTNLVPQTLLDKQFRVEPQAHLLAGNKATVRFQLPKNTVYWVYWVGVGQEPVLQLHELTKQASKLAASALAASNPLVAFGMGLLPFLPQLTSGGNIDYHFFNQGQSVAFMQTGTGKPFAFASGQRIVSDYAKVPLENTPKTPDGYLYMGFQNNNALTGLDVTLKVVAFTGSQAFETRRVRKPLKITTTREPVF
ncbi:MAG: hypothetical protein ACO1O1_05570 [Adhaeribacter sp.]